MIHTLPSKLALGSLALGTLVGCSVTDVSPSELVVPEVVYPSGAPVSEWEDVPEVQVLREALVLEAVAWNELDFSDPDLVFRWGDTTDLAEWAEGAAGSGAIESKYSDNGTGSWTAWGPQPFDVYGVDRLSDDTVHIFGCSGPLIEGRQSRLEPLVTAFTVALFPDGSSVVRGAAGEYDKPDWVGERCHATESFTTGVFEPAPELFDAEDIEVKFPAPMEEYGFDNVSTSESP